MLSGKKRKIAVSALLVALLAAAIIAYFLSPPAGGDVKSAKARRALDRFHKVKRGDLVLGVSLSGTVNAQKKYKIAYKVPFNTKLIYVVDENAHVKEGEVLAKFETEGLEQKIEDLKLDLENKRKSLAIASKERDVLVSTNKATVAAAENRLVDAEEAFNKYVRYDGPRQKDNLELAVDNEEQKLKEMESNYQKELEAFNDTIFSSEADMNTAKLKLEGLAKAVKGQKVALHNATLNLKIFKRYTYPDTVTSLENRLDETKLNLEQVRISTRSKLRQHDDDIYRQKLNIKKVEKDLARYSGYLPMMTINSSVDGIVMYGDPDRRWGRVDVKVGMDAKRNKVFLTIPDLSQLIVNFDLPEQYRQRVSIGDKALVSPESTPNLKIQAVVSKIEALPVNQIGWDPYSPKIYKSILEVTGNHKGLVSGMSVRIETIHSVLKNRLTIPVEAVFERNGQYLVYVKTKTKYKEVPIDIGASNDNFVEITAGLSEGDVVYLFRPFKSSGSGGK